MVNQWILAPKPENPVDPSHPLSSIVYLIDGRAPATG